MDRVLGYEPRGRGFNSCQPHQMSPPVIERFRGIFFGRRRVLGHVVAYGSGATPLRFTSQCCMRRRYPDGVITSRRMVLLKFRGGSNQPQSAVLALLSCYELVRGDRTLWLCLNLLRALQANVPTMLDPMPGRGSADRSMAWVSSRLPSPSFFLLGRAGPRDEALFGGIR